MEITIRDPETGEFTTMRRYIPPITVIFGTTSIEVEEQLDRRAWKINLDESPEQTRRILDFKAKKHHEEFLRLTGRLPEDKRPEIMRCMLDMLEDAHVYVPYAECLRELLKSELLRSRGDYDKLLTLVKLHAWLHQYQRPWLQAKDGKKIIIASPDDFKAAVEMAEDAVFAMQTGLEKRLLEILPIVVELAEEEITVGKTETVGVTSRILAEALTKRGKPISQKHARNYLNALVAYGILTFEKMGNTNVYRLARPHDALIEELKATAIRKKAEDLMDKVQSLYEECLRSEQELRTPERPSACHTAPFWPPQVDAQSICDLRLCDARHTSPSSGVPVPEGAKSHEEEGHNMSGSSALSQKAEGLMEILDRSTPTVADVREAIIAELARIAKDKMREEEKEARHGFSREWLVERIMELAEKNGLGITRERAEAVFASLEEDGFIFKPEGGGYLWTR